MINVQNLNFEWRDDGIARAVLCNISFRVSQHEILAIVGPSGCGKTTLLRLLTGYLKPSSGSVTILDSNVPSSVRYGVLYQDHRLIAWRTVSDNILLPAAIRALSDNSEAKLADLATRLRLNAHLNFYPAQLSGGLKERTALARALISEPQILLLDEPLDSTDYMHRLEIEDFLHSYVRSGQRCCVLVTHDLEAATAFADRVLVLPGNVRSAAVLLQLSDSIRELRPSAARLSGEAPAQLTRLLEAYRTLEGK